jgi:pimeloyl-ACP methyl ester carboxylesterase
MIGELGDEYHNIAPDIIGFGDSTHPEPPPAGLAEFTQLRVDSLLALLDTLGVDKVALVGNSMGGIISMRLAVQAPDRVERLVLMGSGGAPDLFTPELFRLITFYNDPTVEAMAELMSCFVYDPAFFDGKLEEIAAADSIYSILVIVRLRANRPPEILEAGDLKRLDLHADEGSSVQTDLGQLGRPDPDGEHVWLGVEALKVAADPGDGDPGWGGRFDDMVAYARSKGWVDGDEMRAHIVRGG